jgi:hypothetical protein
MTIFYWLIPLFALVVAVAVLPVLYGTLKHERWELEEAAHKESQQKVISAVASGATQAQSPHVHVALQVARDEVIALKRRIEHLSQRVESESHDESVSGNARAMADTGHRG